MKKTILSLFICSLLITACYKQQSPNLSYSEDLGYNIYEMLGFPQEDVLKQLIKNDIEPELVSQEYNAYLFPSAIFDEGEETAYLNFKEKEDDPSLFLYEYGIQVKYTEWPDETNSLHSSIPSLYQKMISLYGKPNETSPTMHDPASIMNVPGNRNATWILEDQNLRISFFVEYGDGAYPFRAGFSYTDLKEYNRWIASL